MSPPQHRCPSCFGTGRNKRGGPCQPCRGTGRVGAVTATAVGIGALIRGLIALAALAVFVTLVIVIATGH